MTLTEINTILSQIAEQKTREKIIEFSFTLLQWMGITPNAGNKPQLLSPQTQKLKEYLANAPQTVQPQLYRISADGQNIRVRFAVLKKIKKENISQLVDNDPGLTSYQASVKGIVNIPGRPPYIPSQPYYIHFATTPDYDKLVLIFNQREQKRILVFRKRLSQTQYIKILPNWQNISGKSKPEIAQQFWNSLDVKEVNKEFYKHIKEQFDSLIGIAKSQNKDFDETLTKQFAVRFIGRYIFCWFLKEKEIIPQALVSSETIEKFKDSFFQSLLSKLFFKTLNAEVTDLARIETITPLDELYKNIPYLNGGLFDWHPEDVLFEVLDLNEWLIGFVKVLESFDFTVDESSSQYQLVAIDPEMLGRIFENLLASQNPDTEKMANQRKAFGAFYTPREIVDYMVNESLKAFIETQLLPQLTEQADKANEPPVEIKGTLFQDVVAEPQNTRYSSSEIAEIESKRERLKLKVNKLFAPDCIENPFDKDETIQLRKALSEIKVLDPACGSGAFPMGVMLRLMELRQIIGHGHRNNYDLKEEILSKNIFGVDIMPMAVEIARLRAWLSLVLESEYKPVDRKNNFGIAALPNLDFKFVCANSLIDVPDDPYVVNMAANHISDFEKLTTLYFNSSDYQKKELKIKIEDCINVITEIHQKAIESFEKKIKKVQKITTEAKLKGMLENKNHFEQQHKLWQSYKNIFTNKTVGFFNTKYFFPSVKNGFDVVIGNPPYIQMQKDNGRLANQLENQGYMTFERTGDVYAVFYEHGFNVLKKEGIHAFITSSQWMKANYGKSLQKLFLLKNPLKLIALGPGVFESAVVDTNILIAKNEKNKKELKGCTIDKPEQLNSLHSLPYHPMPYVTIEKWVILDDTKQTINGKIISKGKPLFEWDVKINFGIKTGFNEAFIIGEAKRNELIKDDAKNGEIIRPILRGREIEKYYTKWDGGYIISTFPALQIDINKYKAVKKYLEGFLPKLNQDGVSFINNAGKKENTRKKTGNEWFETQDQIGYYRELSKEKIIWKRIGSQLRFSYSDNEIYCLDSTCIATGEKIKYLTALLNSKLCNYQLFETAPKTGMGDLIISVQALEPLLVYYPAEKEQKQIEKLVDEIIQNKKSNQDTTALEREIDVLVYKLYELTYKEVKIVDKDFWLSEEEYNALEIC